MSKSASFKSGRSGLSSTVSASKTHFINQRPLENPRGLKMAKETSVMEKKKSSMPDRPPGNSLVRAVASVAVQKLDSKMAKNGIKLKNTSESNMNKVSDVPNSLGVNGTKKHLTSSSNRSGGESFSVEHSAEDKRARQHSKEGACGSSSAIDKLYNNTDAVPKRGILQSVESSHRDDKTKDHNTSNSPRKVLSNGNWVLRCLRCNETSHATQFCSRNKIKLSALRPSAEQNSRAANKKGNRWKDAVEAAITKSRIQKSSRQLDEPEGFPVSSADMSFDVVTSRQEILRSSEPDPSKRTDAADLGQQAMQPIKVSSTPPLGDLSANVPVTDELNVNRVMHILPDEASLFSKPFRTSAIPELNFIWHGSIEVLTTRRDHELFDGIQVHLSSCASLKVHDVVIKFSSTLQLEEVSRISAWPWQFQGTSPKEENIALFLFAKDIESYERSYSKLIEKMLKNDLALRGNIDGIDLLIYPSNNLPLKSQRWNRLFYLWGVFSGRKTDCSKFLPSSQKKPSGAILKAEPLVQDLPCSLSSLVPPPQKAVLVENTGNESPHRSPKSKALKSSTSRDDLSISSFKFDDKMPKLQNYPLFHNSSDRSVADSTVPVVHISSSFPVDHPSGNMNHLSSLLVTHPESTFQMNTSQSCPEVKNDDTYPRNIDHDPEGKPVKPCVHVTANSEEVDLNRELSPNYSDCRQGMEICRTEKTMAEKDISLTNESVLYDGPQGNQMEVDHLSQEFRPNQKRAHSCSTETGSQASGETSRSTGDPTMWTDNASCSPFKDEREQKKMCYSERHLSTGFREETFCAKLSSKVHPLLVASFSNKEHRKFLDVSCGEAIIHDSPSDGKFFPLEPSPLKTAKADEVVYIVSSDDEETPGSNTPNLELVLGSEKRAPKPKTRHLLFQSVDREVGQKNPLVSAADDEDAALSLSLAVPASKVARPILQSQQLMSDTPHVNTSLLLFSASTDTG
ncbi:uncharacterized protein M6B38_259265 [Iris pallida]|uniref:AIPP2-like SPOC-like domain-containing protein n=1 Tax=Iris pallida TaxID=29817 RepID=A0AAX6IEK2_IRIPA|nr:uncharacterized protein M6B38_259265 [Iris pallida]